MGWNGCRLNKDLYLIFLLIDVCLVKITSIQVHWSMCRCPSDERGTKRSTRGTVSLFCVLCRLPRLWVLRLRLSKNKRGGSQVNGFALRWSSSAMFLLPAASLEHTAPPASASQTLSFPSLLRPTHKAKPNGCFCYSSLLVLTLNVIFFLLLVPEKSSSITIAGIFWLNQSPLVEK